MHLSFFPFFCVFFGNFLYLSPAAYQRSPLLIHSSRSFHSKSLPPPSVVCCCHTAVLLKLAGFHTNKAICARLFFFATLPKALFTTRYSEGTLISKVIVSITLLTLVLKNACCNKLFFTTGTGMCFFCPTSSCTLTFS